MNNLYRFLMKREKTSVLQPRILLRRAALMVLMMAWMMPARAQLPFTLTTPDDVANATESLYWIESSSANGFYAIPHTNNSDVSTTNMPNLKALWYFMDAGSESNTQYYYIVNHNTGYYLKLDGALGSDNTIKIASFGSGGDAFKFSITGSDGQWAFHPKSGSTYYVNKKTSNVSYDKYLKSSSYNDANSKWNIVARNAVTWAHPFSNSTNEEKHYYNIHNATSNGSTFYMSTDDASNPYATVSNVDNSKRIWYFMEADSDNAIPNLKYYYIVNAITGKYLKFTETANGSSQASSLQLYEHDGTETGETENRFQFIVLNATGATYNAYSIMPKLEISYYYNKNASLSPSDNYNSSLSNDMKIGIYNDRGKDNNYAHWMIEETVLVLVKAPIITNNFDGTISLSTTTPGATIYYTTNGDTPDNTSTVYSSAFPLDDATVIKAIAYLDSEYSTVSTYNVPKYTTPTISYNNSTSEITITCTGATGIYYTTDGVTPTTSSTPYSTPFTVSTGATIKAIATHAGYLNSDVATKYIQSDDYSQNYLTFNVLTEGTIPWKSIGSDMEKEIYYRINGGSWTSITAGSDVTISVDAGDVVELKGNNQTYAIDKSNYSGFEGGTATFNISGNIMSLIYGDNFVGETTMSGSYNFCSLFKQSKAVSAENLILPATTLTNYCYRAMFSKALNLTAAPALPATTLAQGCYWYMFEECPISTAPELDATTLVAECYGHMFENCSNLNYIKCLATTKSASNCLTDWVKSVSSTGTFVKKENVTWPTGNSGTPTGWTVVDDGTPDVPTISCDGFEIELSCTTTEAVIYYRLDHSGNYTQYSAPITMAGDTFIECYSEKDGKTSATISQNCEYDDRTIYEYSNQSLDSWIYGGNTITTPYSVNAIDGHSSNYAKGTFNFETDVNLRSPQPTYLWFQHADQSATIYVDNNLVEKHWGGYTAFFVDISGHVHKGTNHIKVALKNNEGNVLAPYSGDFNFNATLGNVKLFTSPYMPSMSYGYDGFHITSTVSSAEATINVKTTIPTGATVVCTISGENCTYTETKSSTGDELVFTTTITDPRLWNGTINPYLYNVKLEIYHDNELYHKYERPYGLRFYEYVFNQIVNGNPYTGFLLNGQPYLLRGVCMHDDLANKANALNDDDYTQEFNIINELGCNFLRLAHYPHPKEVYDKCDQLGIIVQTEAPWVNKSTIGETEDYWTHLDGQCADMVNQHYNHPCIIFWGVGNEINMSYTNTSEGKDFVKGKIEGYRNTIRSLMPNAWVGYTVSHSTQNGLGVFNNPDVDWIGQNIYVGWYIDKTSNNPTGRLTTAINNATSRNTPCAYSEYGCGGTQTCHSDDFKTTTTSGNNPRHDIEYQMWLHEGHIAAIKNKPELLFTSQWQLFDIAVSNRQEGYKVCLDGETVFDNNELKRLNNKGLVERDHVTKKDPFYLYKAWWNQTDKFVHICGKDYEKLTNRVIKCYTNDGNSLSLYVNNTLIETVSVTDNIATFTARNFNGGDVIMVSGETANDTFTFTNNRTAVFTTDGNWNTVSNWSDNVVPTTGSHVEIAAKATIPADYVAHVEEISINEGATLTIADGGQLKHCNEGVTATVQKTIVPYTIEQSNGEEKANGWYFIASPINGNVTPSNVANMLIDTYDLYRLNNYTWENYKAHTDGFTMSNGSGYLYANSNQTTLNFTGTLKPYAASGSTSVTDGWNLIGNPFTYNVYVDRVFYQMNSTRTGIEAVDSYWTNTIAPCTGILVNANGDGDVFFTKDIPTHSSNNNGSLNIVLSQVIEPIDQSLANVKSDNLQGGTTKQSSTIDNAIVSFNEGSELPKFRFGNNAEVYIPQNGEDYAIAFSEGQGEMSLNFKAMENGQYTITVNPENVELGYLHLIDNMTGADIDLLSNPAYTFQAKTTDYESRFRLVFSTNEEGGASTGSAAFAFFSNGNWMISNKGEATLQVVDLTGRILRSETVNGNASLKLNTTQGVYVLRLINGDNVKIQKIVVR